MHDAVAVQGGQGGQAVADDGDGHARLHPRLQRAGGDDHLVDVFPAAVAHAVANPLEHVGHQQPGQVVAVDPLHHHHADAVAIDEVIDVEQIVVLNLGDAGGRAGRRGASPRRSCDVVEPLGRKDLDAPPAA